MDDRPPPRTNAEIIAACGGPKKFGILCGFKRNPGSRGSDMKRRDSITQRRWPTLLENAKRLGLPITLEALFQAEAAAELKRASKKAKPEPQTPIPSDSEAP